MEYLPDTEFIKNIGKQIRKHRNERKMTQFDLAIASGMEENALQRIESGRTNPTIKTLLKITKALHIDFSELFVFEST